MGPDQHNFRINPGQSDLNKECFGRKAKCEGKSDLEKPFLMHVSVAIQLMTTEQSHLLPSVQQRTASSADS